MKTNMHFDHTPFHLRIINYLLFFFANHAAYEIMKRNIVDPSRPQMTAWRMRIPWRIPGATNTHSICVIFIVFPLHSGFINMPKCNVIRPLPVLYTVT